MNWYQWLALYIGANFIAIIVMSLIEFRDFNYPGNTNFNSSDPVGYWARYWYMLREETSATRFAVYLLIYVPGLIVNQLNEVVVRIEERLEQKL